MKIEELKHKVVRNDHGGDCFYINEKGITKEVTSDGFDESPVTTLPKDGSFETTFAVNYEYGIVGNNGDFIPHRPISPGGLKDLITVADLGGDIEDVLDNLESPTVSTKPRLTKKDRVFNYVQGIFTVVCTVKGRDDLYLTIDDEDNLIFSDSVNIYTRPLKEIIDLDQNDFEVGNYQTYLTTIILSRIIDDKFPK